MDINYSEIYNEETCNKKLFNHEFQNTTQNIEIKINEIDQEIPIQKKKFLMKIF